ncbi:hypothetical protein [Flammeovirga sp. EKP202]|uniref:hypothetical protein n=1 Tax=Flammeovirga sp. EKP202 TaxID=2770592 RepID=UPI00165F0BD2|nr:hypothetical protein [Flammeovirga sp. EKP202]MBD0402311.1 hypothetical protein [Flammeovirga sp. EKP202]
MKTVLNVLLLLFFCHFSHAQAIKKVDNYKGWKWEETYVLTNEFISLAVVPDAAGRVLEYNLGDIQSLWINPKEFGQKYSNSEKVKMNEWRNFGGYRLVPTPVENCALGKNGDRSKRWPPPVTIGDAPYSITDIKELEDKVGITVKSGEQHLPVPKWIPKDKTFTKPSKVEEAFTYERSLMIEKNSSKVYYIHTLTNVGEETINRGIMTTSQHQSWSDVKLQDGENFVAYIPFSPKYKMKDGEQYHIGVTPESHWRYVNRNRFPLDKNNPEHVEKYYNIGTNWTGEVAPGIFEIHFDYNLMGGFHMISSESWIAYANKLENTVFVKTFEKYNPQLEYDHGVNIAVFNSGMATGYLETEVKTPIYTLKGKETVTFKETHAAAKVLSLPLLSVNETGVITKRLHFDKQTNHITAQYGTFIKGELYLIALNDQEKIIEEMKVKTVSPLKGIDVDIALEKSFSQLKVVVRDEEGKEYILDSFVVGDL